MRLRIPVKSRHSHTTPFARSGSYLFPAAIATALMLLAGCSTAAPHATITPSAATVADITPAPSQPPLIHETTPATVKSQAPEDPVDALLARMSLQELIGQHLIMWVPGHDSVDSAAADRIREVGPAGIIIYPWNFTSRDAARSMIQGYQKIAREDEPDVALLVCADQEGGRVATFRFDSFVRFPSQYWMGVYDDSLFMKAAGYISGVELRSIGVNMELGPVVDIYPTPDNSIIGDRSLGPDPHVVADLAEAYVEGAHAANLISVAKHFPGHGTTSVDSHGELPIVHLTEAELAPDLYPFHYLVDHGVDAIMTAHILFPEIDPDFPATLSDHFIDGILRREWGFKGVVMTDGLEMKALARNYSIDTTVVRAFNAGVDVLLLYTSDDALEMAHRIERLVAAGEISRETIVAGARRVLELKARYGLLGSH